MENNNEDMVNELSEETPAPVSGEMSIEVSHDDLSVICRLYAPENGGAELSFEQAKQKLSAAGVVYGIDEDALSELILKKEYDKPTHIASGKAVVDGDDGKLVFHFSKDTRTGRPREIGGGRVDYRSLDLYEPVTEGQLLVTRTMATSGTPGMSVKGREIKQRPGKDVIFPKGKNVKINSEKTEMHSKSSGMVQFLNNAVNVSNVYNIKGDCDLSVGNIDFDGSVHITGGVRSGSVIKATGSVVIAGVVEAATIIAGGNVEMKSGMQGADKGKIEAGGSVNALYIERGAVSADGPITVDVAIHSILETGSSITAKGKRGAIIGGRVGAAGNITANYIGTISNTRTEVSVGVMMRKRERIKFLEKEIEKTQAELVKLDQLDVYLERAKDKMPPEQWQELHDSGVNTRISDTENLEIWNEEIADLKHELECAVEGKVHVFNTTFAGTRISIGSVLLKVTDEISYATFKYKDGEIIYVACELSKDRN